MGMAVSPYCWLFWPQSYAKKAPWQAFRPPFCSQFGPRWGTTRTGGRGFRSPPKSQPMTPVLNPTTRIYVDADACPVKDEIYRVASRHGLPVSVVAGTV